MAAPCESVELVELVELVEVVELVELVESMMRDRYNMGARTDVSLQPAVSGRSPGQMVIFDT
ncbi:hypothetical protein [Nesterenkonia sp. DZ6]|uniref:hypothetical protein n=1 Tax=Nesterenkonia sp. DZ6 TaxID=2901229 RepID=UPI001F4C6EED|nr:hypothetical protein [Nesterenkonia sp. DZ6]MCH8561580.1 hypothetical protein [Nesterenkonia sp. DZ6]